MRTLILLLTIGTPALADTCPAAPDHKAALDALFAQVKEAPNPNAANNLSNEMWALWSDAPDAHAQELLDEAMTRRRVADYHGAEKAATALVTYCPDYAEGYNQRAFINYLRADYEAALPDLDETLARSPRHLGALTGRALTFFALGRKAEAALDLRAALKLNPWLTERSLLEAIEAEEESL